MNAYFGVISPIAEHVFADGPATRLETTLSDQQIQNIASPLVIHDMNRPLGYLERDVRRNLVNGPLERRSGVHFPKELTVAVQGEAGRQIVHDVSLLGVAAGDHWVDTFILSPYQPRAARIGRVVAQRGTGNHFNNLSSRLGYGLAEQLSRLALGSFHYRSTFDQYND